MPSAQTGLLVTVCPACLAPCLICVGVCVWVCVCLFASYLFLDHVRIRCIYIMAFSS